ncbi:MAG: DNA polymerase III subunit beta [Longimicrobiales bacterium]
MKIRAERDDLADVLSRAARAVSPRSPLDILQGLLCEVAGSTLTVTGTDLETTIRTQLAVEALGEGSTVIPARLASEAVRKMPVGAVTLSAAEGEVEIAGNGPRFAFRELSAADFPSVAEPVGGGTAMDGDRLIEAIAQVGSAASTDEARPILTGVFFEDHEGSLRLVATDSYRLAVRDLPGVSSQEGLVPIRALRELGRSIGSPKIEAAIGDRTASFISDRGTLDVRLIEGTFPNYRQLLPDAHQGRLTVEREALLEAVGRAALVAEDHIPLRLTMGPGGLDLAVQRQEVGGETEHIDGEYDGDEMTIAFNPRYLSDGVSAVTDDKVHIDVVDGLKPGLLRGASSDDFLYLLMPVRL